MENIGVKVENTVSATQFKKALTGMVEAIISGRIDPHQVAPMMVRGAPGIGKSTIIADVAKSHGLEFVDIRLSQMSPEDLKGIPTPNKVEHTTEWCPSADLPRDPSSKGIILFDEITAAPRELQVAAYELILDRRLGKAYTMPNGWIVCAAGNRVEDRAVAGTMSSALANRLCHYALETSFEDWLKWARSAGINPIIISFLKFRPELLSKMDKKTADQGWPSPRSWAKVSGAMEVYKGDSEMIRLAVAGNVGTSVTQEFMAFYESNCNFDDVLAVLHGDAEVKIPEKNDKKYAYVSAAIYLVLQGDTKEENARRMHGLLKIVKKLSNDWQSMIANAICSGNNRVSAEEVSEMIFNDPDWIPVISQYQSSNMTDIQF